MRRLVRTTSRSSDDLTLWLRLLPAVSRPLLLAERRFRRKLCLVRAVADGRACARRGNGETIDLCKLSALQGGGTSAAGYRLDGGGELL